MSILECGRLLESLEVISPEQRLWGIIEQEIKEPTWTGSSDALETRLTAKYDNQLARILTFPNATGIYLSRLASKMPDRVQRCRRDNNCAGWKIVTS